MTALHKILFAVVGLCVMVGVFFLKHRHSPAPPDLRADDAHPVHIAMGGHDYVVPRYFLVSSPGDDAHLENHEVGSGKARHMQVAQFDIAAALPDLRPVAAVNRAEPYGGHTDSMVTITVVNQPSPPPRSLIQIATDFQARNIDYKTTPGPFGLTREDDATLAGKVPGYHMFGRLYGGELMMTCQHAPGLRCSFDYPLGDQTVTAHFSEQMLGNWTLIYPKIVEFVTALRKD